MSDTVSEVRDAALGCLARREHTREELTRKLLAKGHDRSTVECVVASLSDNDLVSDRRFAEQYVRQRMAVGDGPVKIKFELRRRGVSEELIADFLASADGEWLVRIEEAVRRRFGDAPCTDVRERGRRARFLQRKGFTGEQIARALRS